MGLVGGAGRNHICSVDSSAGVRGRSIHRSKIRAGFTLMEVLLVLAILATVAALAAPSFESMISGRRLKNNAERLSLELSDARLEALRTGQAQMFTAMVGGTEYSIKPWMDGYDEVNASSGAIIQRSMDGQTIDTSGAMRDLSSPDGLENLKTLESGLQFYGVDTLLDTRSAAAVEAKTGTVPTQAAAVTDGESNPIIFYPDGTSTTAKIQMIDDRGRRMIIELRGVTGRINFYRALGVDAGAFTAAPPTTGGN